MMASALESLLEQGLEELGLAISETQQIQLLAYLDLLAHWNRRFNLTAVRERRQMVTRHLLDSLAVVPFLGAAQVIDVGTGAGLPGIPLAIADPTRRYTLLDSNGKKTRFLVQAKAELLLDQVSVVHSRVEDYRPEKPYGQVLSRAFTSLDAMIASCHRLVAADGEFLAMKGQRPTEELAALPEGVELRAVEALQIPDLNEERCLVRLSLKGDRK